MPDTIMAAPVALPMQLRRAPILPATVNSETRSVDVVFTTGAAVRRRRWTGWDTSVPFDEILDVSDRAVDLTRLNAGAPALDSHSVWSSHSQVGERDRVSTIYDLAGRLNLERGFAEDLVKRGVTVDESRRLILDQVAARSDETRTFPHVSTCASPRYRTRAPASG